MWKPKKESTSRRRKAFIESCSKNVVDNLDKRRFSGMLRGGTKLEGEEAKSGDQAMETLCENKLSMKSVNKWGQMVS